LTVATLSRSGWKPDPFVVGVLFPTFVLIVLSCLAVVVSSRRALYEPAG